MSQDNETKPAAPAAEGSPPPELRRALTGRDGTGKSVFVSFAPPPRVITYETSPGLVFWEMYATQSTPSLTGLEPDPTPGLANLVAGPGETRFRLVQFPPPPPEGWQPEPGWFDKAFKEFDEKTPGFAEHFEKDNFPMHTTDTVDYGVVVRGEIILELDDAKTVHLRQGDCVIQNGTRHRWRNPRPEPCLMAFIMVGAERKRG
jgi:mannose-6-phosphate isomerase-like protein (cupin superfamily)